MREWRLALAGAASVLLSALGGCSSDKPVEASKAPVTVPSHLAGTVREYAVYDTSGAVPVQGFGLVQGLGTNGSGNVPEHVREYMEQYLKRLGIGDPTKGLGHISASKILEDRDTAVVLVGGAIPFGAPVGARFDIDLAAMPNTQTRSLQGGDLMTTELRLDMGAAVPGGPTKPLAEGAGSVFVNPFVEPNDDRDLSKWREGRVLGGGKVVYAHPIRLLLRQPDLPRASLISRRLKETFGEKVVVTADRTGVALAVPREWRDRYEHFLELVMHVTLAGGQWDVRARQLVRLLEAPEAPHEEISLVLEAMGRNVVPFLKALYSSRNPAAVFYAARTASRLGDEPAEQILIRIAREVNSPYRLAAIEEMGLDDRMGAAPHVLQELIDDDDNLVRIAAYEALVRRRDTSVITTFSIDNRMKLDLVRSKRNYVIYATQTKEPRLAIFGAEMPVSLPVFFSPPDDLVTIRSLPEQQKLAVFRKMPAGGYSSVVYCKPTVPALVLELASIPDRNDEGEVHGLRLNYSQVLSVLYRMCRRGDIPAKFSLQSDTAALKIRGAGRSAGRPDVPAK